MRKYLAGKAPLPPTLVFAHCVIRGNDQSRAGIMMRNGDSRGAFRAGRGHVAAAFFALMLPLSACSAGPDSIGSQDDIVQPVAPSNQPGAVSRKPLLPPVPEAPPAQAAQPGQNWSTSPPPLQYDRLYSDDEQAKIQADLLKAAARARAN